MAMATPRELSRALLGVGSVPCPLTQATQVAQGVRSTVTFPLRMPPGAREPQGLVLRKAGASWCRPGAHFQSSNRSERPVFFRCPPLLLPPPSTRTRPAAYAQLFACSLTNRRNVTLRFAGNAVPTRWRRHKALPPRRISCSICRAFAAFRRLLRSWLCTR